MNRTTEHSTFFAGLLTFAVAVVSSGCVNEPSPVGSDLLPRSDLIIGDTLNLVASHSISVTSVPDSFVSWSTVAIGRSSAMEALGIVRFDGFSETFGNIAVQRAEIRLRSLYHLGDTLNQITVNVRKILTDWRATNLTFQAVQSGGFFAEPPVSTTPLEATSDSTAKLELDTALVSSWFRADSANPNHGILLQPTAASNGVIRGFLTPELYIIYTLPDSVDSDTTTFSAATGDYGFVAGTGDTTFLADSTLLHIRGGAAYRGIVNFNTSVLPPFAAVHRALLEISTDEGSSDFSSTAQDSLFVIFVDDEGFVDALAALSEVASDSMVKTYTFNVTSMVQFWTQGLGIPRLGIRAYNERNGLDGFTLHGSAAPDPVRPRLSIIYSSTRP